MNGVTSGAQRVALTFPNLCRERSPAAAAQDAALRRGVGLPEGVAREIAGAEFEFADNEDRVGCGVADSYWPQARESVVRKLRVRVVVEVAEPGLLPNGLPREAMTQPPPGRPWEYVSVELVVLVRRPT